MSPSIISARASRDSKTQIAGIVLVGTNAWGRSAFDRLTPRPLLPIAHRPLITYAFSWLHDAGVSNVAVCANRQTQILESRLNLDVPTGMSVSFLEDPMPRGAAGAVRDAADISAAEDFVVIDGTCVPSVNLADLLQSHHASGAAATVVTYDERGSHGGPNVQVPTGIYVFNRRALACVPSTGFFDIKENLIQQLHRIGERVNGFVAAQPSPRVLDASSYLAVNAWMVEHLAAGAELRNGYSRCGSGLVHRDAVVAADATFVGPVMVGPGARIHAGAMIVGPATIGLEVSVGSDALISRSAVWRRSSISAGATVDRCILGDGSIVKGEARLYGHVTEAVGRRLVPGKLRLPLAEVPPVEMLRRMGRVFLGSSWSRFPAAE